MGDPLERLAATIPWESFRPLLAQVREKERESNAGRKPLDVVLMFKALILQSLYNLADEQVEYQIRDRLSFARFLGPGIEDEVPDATTVWRFRERLKELGLIEPLFDRFVDHLTAEGFKPSRADRRRLHCSCPDPAQPPRGEPPHKRGGCPAGPERGQTRAEGYRCALDEEAGQEHHSAKVAEQ